MNFIYNKKIKIILIFIIFIQLIFLANIRLNFKIEIFKKSFVKDYGANYILPKSVLELKFISERNNYKKINVSNEIKDNDFLLQRITEFIYPTKLDFNLSEIFYLQSEKIPFSCGKLKEFEYLVLVKC